MKFPNESAEYRKARNALLESEIELRRAAERVARGRRELPVGGVIPEDYVFEAPHDRGAAHVRLSELFGDKQTLLIYSFMFGPEKKHPCVMCTPLLDGLNGIEDHVRQRLSFVVVAESPAARLALWKRERNWLRLPLVSCAGNTYNRDYHGKNPKGEDETFINVFRKKDGKIYHFWGSELVEGPRDPGEDHRAVDMINPIFAMFDMTPEGRGDHYTRLGYQSAITE